MAEDYKSYRIRTTVGGEENVLHVKLTQTYDTLEVLSLKIDQINSYKTYKSDYGVVIGRVFANGGYGVPNAKVSVFIPSENGDTMNENILYPFRTVKSLDNDNVRYNLLPDFVDAACHQNVGTFPNKRMVLDNDDIVEVFDKYYTYTTTTNNAGDYMIFGVPTGMNTIHMDVDLSDIGTLSQKPRDFIYKGYNIEQFDSPTKFKSSTNLSSLAQIMSEDKQVYVYPYWGDTSDTDDDIAITRCDFELAYKFEPTCVFMGSIVTDTGSNAISKKCTPDVQNGQMSELVAGNGTIEMIRKTFDNKIEQYAVNGNQNIDENGVWCYQIPMNLDYIVTDEFGNIVPSNDPERGIPTRARVRFRVSLNEMEGDGKARNRSRYLIPNNPRLDEKRYPEFFKTKEVDYEFGTMTRDEDYCDLFWNNVYTVKNYIPRLQTNSWVKNGSRHYGGIKMISHYGDNSPMPYNQVTTRLSATYRFLCIIYKFILYLIKFVNGIISYVIGGIIGIIASPFCTLAKISIFGLHPFGFFNPVCKALKKLIPSCIGIDGSVCGDNTSHAYTYYPGCGDFSSGLGIGAWINTKNSHYKNQTKEIKDGERESDERTQPKLDYDELKNCIETSLGEEYDTISFNFNNDWVNGVLYMPLWWRAIRPKRTYFFGLIKKKASDNWCSSEFVFNNKTLQAVQPCAVNLNGDITNGSSVGCGKKNEGCMTAKSVVGFRNGVIVKKQTMLGQDVYYYASCEVDVDSTQVDRTPTKEIDRYSVKLLYATDIVLLGSLNDNDVNGIPQFYKSLDNTTYKMPPTVLQATNLVSAEVDEDGDVSYSQTSETEYTGRDWGNSNNDLCDSDDDTSKDGGLFYSIGCSSLRMTPKSCVNASRICEFGVTLDTTTDVITKNIENEDTRLSDAMEQIIPDGYISFDDLYNHEQRSAFATLNGNYLLTKLNNETGLREYVFKYLNVDNFDGSLYKLMQSTQSKCTKTQKFNYYLEQKSEGYVDFRLGQKPYFYFKGNKRGNYFPRYENSFYFYFGLKEGKTALDKLNKYYVSDCADTMATESPLKIFSKGNDWCALDIDSMNGYVAFDLSAIDLPCTILLIGQNDNDGINQREFRANSDKVYIASQDFDDVEELKGYERITNGVLGVDDKINMVKNDTYEVYLTDGNGDIITTFFTVGPKLMDCVITPTNFITPYNRLKERYNSAYKIMAIREFEDPEDGTTLHYTTNLSRKIGGTINVSWPKDGDTQENLQNFTIRITCDDLSLGYAVLLKVCGGVVESSGTVVSNYDSLLFKQIPSLDGTGGENDFGGFIFGIPQGESTYTVVVTQTCPVLDNGMTFYVETNNILKKSFVITDKTRYRLFINDVDYDVIKHWKCGFDVKNINSYYNTAKIYEEGNISNEWFKLTDKDNYRWEESYDYNKIDKSLVDLVKAKYETLTNLTEDETLAGLYNMLLEPLSDDYSYGELTGNERYIVKYHGKNFLYSTALNGTIKHDNISILKQGLEKEIDALTNNCVVENKDQISYFEFNTTKYYGKIAYEKVFGDIYAESYNEKEYVTEEEYDNLGEYLKKEFSYYKYEFVDINSGDSILYYGYNDLPEPDGNGYSTEKKSCSAYRYIGCTIPRDIEVKDSRPTENFNQYIPYLYKINGVVDRQCGTDENTGKDVFVEPGFFEVTKWISINDIDGGGVTLGDVDNSGERPNCDSSHMIWAMTMVAIRYMTYIPYLGYNTLQYNTKGQNYAPSTYIKVVDVVEYSSTSHAATHGIYQYVRLHLGQMANGVPYICLNGNNFEYYKPGDDLSNVYFIDSTPYTLSTAEMYARVGDNWYNDVVWHDGSRCYVLTEDDIQYLYVPQYAPYDKRNVTKCTTQEYNNLPTYGKYGYDTSTGNEEYRNLYIEDIESDEYILTSAKYNALPFKGQIDYQPSEYAPVKLVSGAINTQDPNSYGETLKLTDNSEGAIGVYEYEFVNDDTVEYNLGDIIDFATYEYADFLQEYYVPKRYLSNSGEPYHYEFVYEEVEDDIDCCSDSSDSSDGSRDLLLTAKELETITPHSRRFYQKFAYKYTITEDDLYNGESEISTVAKRFFIRETDTIIEGDVEKVIYSYTTSTPDALDISIDRNYYILDTNNPEEARIPISVTKETALYFNIVERTDIIDSTEYCKISQYMKSEYVPCTYEEKVGTYEFPDNGCADPDAIHIDGYFEDIVSYDMAMLEQLDNALEFKNNFINAAKEAFWLSCPDKEHILTFTAITDDRPAIFHLVYKQEVYTENEIDGSTNINLNATDSYICDGTSDIVITIPTICSSEGEVWSNSCHPISTQPDLCFARDNTSGGCTLGANDAYYRKAFFVAVVNGKEDIIPDGTLDSKKIPSKFFGVHVLDKRFINNIIIWPYIKGIPRFTTATQTANSTPVLINMFGSITGGFKNGVTAYNEKDGYNGYYNTFASQHLEGDYTYDLVIYTSGGTIDEDRLGINRYVIGEQDDDEGNLINDVKETVRSLEGDIEIADENALNRFKPFKTYEVLENMDSDKQCAILTPSQFDLSIVDGNDCGVTQTVNGDIEITLNSKSVNDLRSYLTRARNAEPSSILNHVVWGYFPHDMFGLGIYQMRRISTPIGDDTLLKLDIKNGDVDDFNFYVFDYVSGTGDSSSYPLCYSNLEKINQCNYLYRLKYENFGDPLEPFKNDIANSKYIFGQNADPNFTTSQKKYAYVKKQDGKCNNGNTFYDYLENHVKYGNLTATVNCKVGESDTTNLFYSVNEDVTIDEIITQQNEMVLHAKEHFVSSMTCESCKHCKNNWRYYDPKPQGRVIVGSGMEVDLPEYVMYVGFSQTGEFAANGKMTVFYKDGLWGTSATTYREDDCEEYDDDNKATVNTAETCACVDTTESHKPIYVVAISKEGMTRAISPVYDFRPCKIAYEKVSLNNSLYYKFCIENANERFYFWHYDYVVNYKIDYGKNVTTSYEDEDGNTKTEIVFVTEATVTGVLQHPSERTSGLTTMDCLILIPDSWTSKGTQDERIVGEITLTDKVGLKHLYRLNKIHEDLQGETTTTLISYTFKTNGGVWIETGGQMNYTIPEEYLNTSKDYTIMIESSASVNQIINDCKNNLGQQLKREQYGVSYDFDGWTQTDNTFTAKWAVDDESLIDKVTCTIKWLWHKNGDNIDAFTETYETLAVEGEYVRLPNSIRPEQLIELNVGAVSARYFFNNEWQIQLTQGGYGTIKSDEYFMSGDEKYNWIINGSDKSIELHAVYDVPELLTLYFVDDGIYYDNPGANYTTETNVVVDGVTIPRAAKTAIDEGMNISYFNENYAWNGPARKNDLRYEFVEWATETHDEVITNDNTIINGIWNYYLTFNISYNINAQVNGSTEHMSLTSCIVVVESTQSGSPVTYEKVIDVTNPGTNSLVVDNMTFTFSNNDEKPTNPLSNTPLNSGLLQIKGVYIGLDAAEYCCFFVNTTNPTHTFHEREYKVCNSGCNVVGDTSGYDNICKITFDTIIVPS